MSMLAKATPTNQRGEARHTHNHVPRGAALKSLEAELGELCTEPSDLRLQLNSLQTGDTMSGRLHETFYMLPLLQQVIKDETNRPDFRQESFNRDKVFSGTPECPREEAEASEESLKGEPCPSYTSINYDQNRYPRVLLETRCRACEECRGVSTTTDKQGRPVIPTCDGVYFHVRVLRRLRACRDGVYQYEPTWQKLQVGCACRLVQVQSAQ